MATVYLETTIISYLAANPSRDVVTAGHQQTTHEWWNEERSNYHCFVSDFVLQEIQAGNPQQSQKRTVLVDGIEILRANEQIMGLAAEYAKVLGLPGKAKLDSQHLAICVWYNVDYLLTWNMKHLAGARVRKLVTDFNRTHNLFQTIVCVPGQLSEE